MGNWTVVITAIALVAASAGCGSSSSTTAASAVDLTGSWTGTWRFVTGAVTITDAITATTTPYVGQVTTSWQAASGATGSFLVTPGATISGVFSVQIPGSGLNCTGTGTLSGTASPTSIAFDVPSISGSNCQWSTGNHFDLHRP